MLISSVLPEESIILFLSRLRELLPFQIIKKAVNAYPKIDRDCYSDDECHEESNQNPYNHGAGYRTVFVSDYSVPVVATHAFLHAAVCKTNDDKN